MNLWSPAFAGLLDRPVLVNVVSDSGLEVMRSMSLSKGLGQR